ncbi:extensin family protein [uncultured Sphingomonas sp.]|uniref:extensin-like domain-containing protein n=1 Tax=uncultured Sphingomonas sp. TaxID=158754 RepID=UPI00260060EB|nr:extensin family protein [uncultured Sphingomonas sp.]
MKALKQTLWVLLVFALIAGGALLLLLWTRSRPQDVPWTPLDLSQPIGAFTGRKLAGLGTDDGQCRALLTRAGVHYEKLAPVERQGECGYANGVRFTGGGSRTIGFSPGLGTACPVAAGLALWEWNIVQPEAQKQFGSRVVRIEHFGSYSCRRMYGRTTGDWSEHARANAVDIAAFVLADGRRISVLNDWKGEGDKAVFLRAVRDGACRLFATVLSPDYNAAHRDHLHLDQAARGEMGWRACR